MKIPTESPVSRRLRELPHGNADWPGYATVYRRLQQAAQHLASGTYTRCGHDHVETMAVLGCGHEETMKHWVGVCIQNNWVSF